jgi:hypothetical protein
MESKLPTRNERISSKLWIADDVDDDIDGAGDGGSNEEEGPEDEVPESDMEDADDDADTGACNTSRHKKISCADRAKISTDDAPISGIGGG